MCTVPTPFLCLPDPLEKTRDSDSGPCVSMPLALPLNHIRTGRVRSTTADVIREFLHLIGVSHTLTLAYSKQENAIVERYNKKINRHLRALTFENLSLADYKKSLPFVQRILNSNHSDRLKISASHEWNVRATKISDRVGACCEGKRS